MSTTTAKTQHSKPKQASQQASSQKAGKGSPPGVMTPSSERASRDPQEKNGNGRQRKGGKGTNGRR